MHHGDERRFLVHERHKRVRINASVRANGRKTRFYAAIFQRFVAFKHSRMLARRRDGVSAARRGKNRLIVRFRSAGGKNQLKISGIGNGAQQKIARAGEHTRNFRAAMIARGRIEVFFGEIAFRLGDRAR